MERTEATLAGVYFWKIPPGGEYQLTPCTRGEGVNKKRRGKGNVRRKRNK
jgi:hypothetical protein